ncbi:hypothetical protein A3H10_03500 [Candidatus Uhrbacteria bacterium RIFCSPLOWO2_12_FULL_46_10]|uniref:EamA domain-containing protein n=1 Tax=Candidatus Uhrbacteria bacterium RIFCSPLOWO2_01_FULL_47_25 TaxID=1802402 RepID=A0A1F7UPQ6_9BACT|nr:MAG: hypothetical protein UX68_C0020G0022 [Parcubacteria group bacterium GW2011_GWA2_46_9]OGL61018.1 MAG: hypothetical protein A2752_00800 [Candidatus Uhrbacteria bacterium RIFCSPHIGHO2_01_FULL_46_23]OGL69230.1 MAG: hypothetical protein A3D60_05005 [Candidatus Uhrbacteria bacterium RIFCSPHIGHO2_02_FULL_47_29]OGL80293.1 MAG: hypothetical protein A2936_02910 [Candidatus Uhrbacteria bacterium RIFCSPLOWO2_01_FULL_47_25]OGL85368.1 MAG: hypothetical protein A3I37_00815 [Candidatus Uhrbacteria bact
MGYFFLIIALVLNASANMMIKAGSNNIHLFREYGLIYGLLKNYVVIIGIVLFAMNIIFYILALSKINLSIAYPIMTIGGLILITIISYTFLKETITPVQMGGIFILIIGIILVSGKV